MSGEFYFYGGIGLICVSVFLFLTAEVFIYYKRKQLKDSY